MSINTIIFDLGGVLVDWNPRYVYRQIFVTEEAVENFLSTVCTNHWNEMQDEGRSFAEGTSNLINLFPHYTSEINAYYGRWREMLRGQIDESVVILKELKESNKFRLLALTNWSGESFPTAVQIFEFLNWFEGIVVSGDEMMKKPDSRIFKLLLERYNVNPSSALFIDDNLQNIFAAKGIGLNTIHFKNSAQCREELMLFGILS